MNRRNDELPLLEIETFGIKPRSRPKGTFAATFIPDTASEKPPPGNERELGRSEESFRDLSAVISGSEAAMEYVKAADLFCLCGGAVTSN